MIEKPGFEEVAGRARKAMKAAGGGALCIYHNGEPALDIWAGLSDPKNATPWAADTMAMAWSTGKGVASTALHMLADRGQLDYDDLVVRYWPEFAPNGKETTTIGHILAMEAGLYDIRSLIADPRSMLDHDTMAAALAAAVPAHRPGARNGYHAVTYGWLIGELVRRIGGVTLNDFVQTEIVEPLRLDGAYFGTPVDQLGRVAAFPNLPPMNPVARRIAKTVDPVTTVLGLSLSRYAAAFFPVDGHEVIPTDDFLQAEVASMNGVFTARSLARLYAALGDDDGLDGVRLWSPQRRRMATVEQNRRRDRVLAVRAKWRLGYHQPFPRRRSSPSSFGFYGAFGSGAFADPDRRLAVGLTVQAAKGFPLNKLLGPILAAADRSASH